MKKNGFTLVELIIAIVVGLIVMAAVYSAMIMAQKTSANVGRKIVTQQDTRAVLDLMAAEIRVASLNKSAMLTATWNFALIPCAPAPVLDNRGITVATADTLDVAMDINGTSIIGDGNNEYIQYRYVTANNAITRCLSCCALPENILGGAGADTIVVNQAAGIPVFRYFDWQGGELNVTANPFLIPDIRRIKITIVAETAQVDINTNLRRRIIHSTDVLVRNHATLQY